MEGLDEVDCDSLGIVEEEIYPQRTVYEGPQDKIGVGVGVGVGFFLSP